MSAKEGTKIGYTLNQMDAIINLEKQNKEKVENFKKRIESFKEVSDLEDAKALVMKILPVSSEKTSFSIGNGRCVVINNSERLRICFDTPDEFIAYDFE